MARLSQYLTATARLIRDRSFIITPRDELTEYVNLGRNDVARVSGCLRALIVGNAPYGAGATPGLALPGGMTPGNDDTTITTFATISGVEKYHFGYARPYLKAQYAGFDRVIDLITVAVSWGAAARPVMEWESFEDLQALARIYSAGVFTYPFKAALQGDGVNQQVFLFPVPGQALEMEWDTICLPSPLYSDNDAEAIPEPFDGAVKYFAARYVYQASQRFGSAELMEQQGMQHLGLDRAVSSRGQVPSYYTSV